MKDRVTVEFNRFGLAEYQLFLKTKSLPEFQIHFDENTETYILDTPANLAQLGVDAARMTALEPPKKKRGRKAKDVTES